MGLDMEIRYINHDIQENYEIGAVDLRKANHIRGWFSKLDNFNDNGETKLSAGKLKELYKLATKILIERPTAEELEELLPPTEGFFFGAKEVGEWYFEDLLLLVSGLDKVAFELLEEYKQNVSFLDVSDNVEFIYWEWY